MKNMTTFMARIAEQGKITIPSNVRKFLNLSTGIYIEVKILTIHTKPHLDPNDQSYKIEIES